METSSLLPARFIRALRSNIASAMIVFADLGKGPLSLEHGVWVLLSVGGGLALRWCLG